MTNNDTTKNDKKHAKQAGSSGLYWLAPFLNGTAATMQVTPQYVQVTP
jgi:hypothetical protein